MAVDENPTLSPNKVTPARDHRPEGLVDASLAASGGQPYPAGDVKVTPSMGAKGTSSGTWRGPTGTTAGDPPAD